MACQTLQVEARCAGLPMLMTSPGMRRCWGLCPAPDRELRGSANNDALGFRWVATDVAGKLG
jgi:hypothetical protein